MNTITIDLNDYVRSGEGFNGESYFHKSDPNLLLKLFPAGKSVEIAKKELEAGSIAYEIGIPTPKPGDLVTDGNGRYGIRFQRIRDKVSICRACGENPASVGVLASRFADMCRILHSKVVPAGTFPCVKDQYLDILDHTDIYTPEEDAWFRSKIAAAPDATTAIHGDLQFGNAISAGGKDYFIDLGDFSYGHPYFDLGMVLFTSKYDNPDFLRKVFHMEPATAAEFWHHFVKAYFGPEADPDDIEKILRPYAALKLLIIERDSGAAIPGYHWLIKD